ncbi:MAG: peptidylprolyl isomerase [Proteobacteria bacterium]|nr:peptidylprolyl isomerase [Pseudomonadota bacterium]MBU1709281.1 peptidylprolyl isomerase [Pseudomonadota bacterium]
MFKPLSKTLAALYIFLFAFTLTNSVRAEEKKAAEDNVAVVNGAVISKQYFQRVVSAAQSQHLARTGAELEGEALTKAKEEILENLIGGELLFQESTKADVKVEETMINEQLANLKSRFPDEDGFKGWLAQMNFTEDEIKKDIRKGLAVDQLIKNSFVSKIEVPDQEIKAYFDNNPQFFQKPDTIRASHILIKVDQNASAEDKEKAKNKLIEAQKKLKEGQDFAALAKEYSQCPSSAEGGDLNYFEKGRMVPAFDQTAFALKIDEVSDIVETRFGYHLIKVTDIKAGQTITYDDIQGQIKQFLVQEKVQKQVMRHVEELKSNAKIERLFDEKKS